MEEVSTVMAKNYESLPISSNTPDLSFFFKESLAQI